MIFRFFHLLQNRKNVKYGSRLITVPAVISPLFLTIGLDCITLYTSAVHAGYASQPLLLGLQKRHTHNSQPRY